MMDALTAFHYREGNTILHRLDPRAKLLLSVSLILFLWIRTDLQVLLLAVPPLTLLIALGRLRRDLQGALRVYILLGLILLPLNGLLYSIYAPIDSEDLVIVLTITGEGTPILGELFITREALEFSLVIYIRLILILLAVSIFIMTTNLDEIQALLFKLRFPYLFVLTLGFAFRFIPTLAEEAERIREAQMARGLDPGSGSLLRRYWKAIIPMFFPLMVSVLRRSLLFAEALEARATFVHPRRTVLTDLSFKGRDVAAVTASLAFLGVSFLLLYLRPIL
ncbi:MAG: energy-coupling factor transporter transmembrane component T family protein [Thermoplasmata archaeon]